MVSAQPVDHDRPQGTWAHRGPGCGLLPDRDDPVAGQTRVRPPVRLRTALRTAAAELLPARLFPGGGRRADAGGGRRDRFGSNPDARRLWRRKVHGDCRCRPLHRDGPRPRVHRRADRRDDGREWSAARPHGCVSVRPVGVHHGRLGAGRRARRISGGDAQPARGLFPGGVLSAHLLDHGGVLRPRDAHPRGQGGVRRDVAGDPRDARRARNLARRRLHLLLLVQPVFRARVPVLSNGHPEVQPAVHRPSRGDRRPLCGRRGGCRSSAS